MSTYVTRAGYEAYSYASTGKSLTQRESEAAVKLQAVVRGKKARDDVDEMIEEENGACWFLCSCNKRRTRPPKSSMLALSPARPAS